MTRLHPLVGASFRILITLLGAGTLLFGSAGTLAWWNGWVLLAALAALALLTGALFLRSPGLATERFTAHRRAPRVDRIIVILIGYVLPPAALVLAGLDHRFTWTAPLPCALALAAALPQAAGIALAAWSMRANNFFSSHVRIQEDRGHQVVSTGPYAFVRHPGYAGAILFYLALPVLLGSLAALPVILVQIAVIALRIPLEERVLRQGLPGYPAYCHKVPYRLLPKVW